MTYNIMKIMKDPTTGKMINILLLDGLSVVLEIKELHIKAVVADEESKGSFWDSDAEDDEDFKESIVQSCVDQVLQILKEKSER